MMRKELGDDAADKLMAMGPCPFELKACPWTGSWDDALKVWWVDMKKLVKSQLTGKESNLHNATDADEDDINEFEEDGKVGASGSAAAVVEKVVLNELVEKSEKEISKEMFEAIVRNPKPEKQELSGLKCDEVKWLKQAKKDA